MTLLLCVLFCRYAPEKLTVLEGWGFFERLSPLHLLWLVWVVDMADQLIPLGNHISLGSRKPFARYYRPAAAWTEGELRTYINGANRLAYQVFGLWALLIAALGGLFYTGRLSVAGLFLISVFFYVCDLICVLIWCPFRLLLKNRCCTSCRIFNWDHLMMFTPLLFVRGFFGYSLLALAFLAWLAWELAVALHPERFWERSNAALQCANCTDKLCTQYCGKLRRGLHTTP